MKINAVDGWQNDGAGRGGNCQGGRGGGGGSDRDGREGEDKSVLQGESETSSPKNWGDVAETVTDVARAGAWSVTTGLKYCADTHTHTQSPAHKHTHTQPSAASLLKVNGGKKKHGTSHPINVTKDTECIFLSVRVRKCLCAWVCACRDPGGPWEMNICPIDLDHLIQSWSALLRWRQSHSPGSLKVMG